MWRQNNEEISRKYSIRVKEIMTDPCHAPWSIIWPIEIWPPCSYWPVEVSPLDRRSVSKRNVTMRHYFLHANTLKPNLKSRNWIFDVVGNYYIIFLFNTNWNNCKYIFILLVYSLAYYIIWYSSLYDFYRMFCM